MRALAIACLFSGACTTAPEAYTVSGTVRVPEASGDSVDRIVYELTGDVAISGEVSPGAFTIPEVPAGDYSLAIDAWHLVSTDGNAPAWQTIATTTESVVVAGPVDLGSLVLSEIPR
jgi:hypothetical protein